MRPNRCPALPARRPPWQPCTRDSMPAAGQGGSWLSCGHGEGGSAHPPVGAPALPPGTNLDAVAVQRVHALPQLHIIVARDVHNLGAQAGGILRAASAATSGAARARRARAGRGRRESNGAPRAGAQRVGGGRTSFQVPSTAAEEGEGPPGAWPMPLPPSPPPPPLASSLLPLLLHIERGVPLPLLLSPARWDSARHATGVTHWRSWPANARARPRRAIAESAGC
jgi:hypothetical protein